MHLPFYTTSTTLVLQGVRLVVKIREFRIDHNLRWMHPFGVILSTMQSDGQPLHIVERITSNGSVDLKLWPIRNLRIFTTKRSPCKHLLVWTRSIESMFLVLVYCYVPWLFRDDSPAKRIYVPPDNDDVRNAWFHTMCHFFSFFVVCDFIPVSAK